MSCPHCATADPLRGVEPLDVVTESDRCVRCGHLLSSAPQQPQLEGLELTGIVGGAGDGADPPMLPGMVSTAEELGDDPRLPSDDEGFDEEARCRRCGADVVDEAQDGFCPKCGGRVRGVKRLEAEKAPQLLCLACGVPNPQSRALCLACGERL